MSADVVGGVWTYCVELAEALAPYDVQVHLATMGGPLSSSQRRQSLVFAAVHESSFRLEWMADAWADVDEAGSWLLGLESQLEPDLVHLNGYGHAALPWHAPTLVVGHSDVLSWWRAVHGCAAPPEWEDYRRRVEAGLRAADRVLAPTAAVTADLSREYGFGAAAIVPNCRELAVPPQPKERLVLAVGRTWDAAKGFDVLARAARHAGAPVVLAGERSGAGDEGQADGLRLLGPLGTDELLDWYARAAFFAAPARYEPFGLAALEAGLAGCALVLGDLPSLREVWAEAATYVTGETALAHALQALTADPELAARRGAAARDWALLYTRERTGAGYHTHYRELVESAAAAGVSS